ncbi:hypothetical protein KAK06_23705 [Ideonella sp. 4Y11]|uniref:Uncharacterized protein n=1 Tax=Ideonella aquatica TaxID=2824119 RepID=A0A941BNG6_9BURK|nr:hypothetical protein [Ideonella aquatica]MBQ0961964.1 hypothetical protein [Ideonella aquatica]
MDVLATIQNAIEIAGKLRNLSKKIEDAEFRMLVADLSGDLADAKLEVADLKLRLAQSLEESRQLNERLEQRDASKPTLSDGAYKFEGEDGLFCTACFDTLAKKVRVTPLTGAFKTFGKWRCPSCKATLA